MKKKAKQDSNIEDSSAEVLNKNVQDSEVKNSESAQNAQDSEKDSKIKELEEKYLRAYAEFENVKKRLEREKFQGLEYANEAIIKDLLPVLDTLESALGNPDDENNEVAKKINDGIKLTFEKFLSTLGKYGLSAIDSSGEFDPNLHNAIMQVADETRQNGEIAQVLQKGYKYKERVLRPSMVSIVKNN